MILTFRLYSLKAAPVTQMLTSCYHQKVHVALLNREPVCLLGVTISSLYKT
jgi:hypothetical protein